MDFTSGLVNRGGAANGATMSTPFQIAFDAQGRLWVADQGNNRVLCFHDASSIADGASADRVYGQPGFSTPSEEGTTAATMRRPTGVAVGPDDTLWVADASNHRVLRFDNITDKPSGANADGVLGQADFLSNDLGTSATEMSEPYALAVDSQGRLWVADSSNHRILRFDNAAQKDNGAPADGVLGQDDFDSREDGLGPNRLFYPYGVLAAPDGTLWVGDYSNGRVLGFLRAASKPNGGNADLVLGKPNFTSELAGPTRSLLSGPVSPCLGPNGSILVPDFDDNRVVRFSPVRAPRLTILTKGGRTAWKRVAVRGTTVGEVVNVNWRAGNRGGFRRASGTSRWSFSAPLRTKRTVFSVFARGPAESSPTRRVTFTRR